MIFKLVKNVAVTNFLNRKHLKYLGNLMGKTKNVVFWQQITLHYNGVIVLTHKLRQNLCSA